MSRGRSNERLVERQRRNLKSYLKIIHQTRIALEAGDVLRALALVKGNIKYPPDFVRGLNNHGDHWVCTECGNQMEEPRDDKTI